MNTELLLKYVSGTATEMEKQRVTEWIQESPENMREYMTLCKIHDITLWNDETNNKFGKSVREHFLNLSKVLTLRRVGVELIKVAILIGIAFLCAYYFMSYSNKESSIACGDPAQSIFVPAGQRAELTLADGTKVWLNSRTTLVFPGEFNGDKRKVLLDGEGYFAVATNKDKPFIVETSKFSIRALGTEFDIKAYSDDDVWETSLLNGLVEIFSEEQESMVTKIEPNTTVFFAGNSLKKRNIYESEYFRWREGLICFNNISVQEMFERIELYYGVDFIVKNKKILHYRYTGKFRMDDGVEQVLKVLKLKHKFTYNRDEESNIITIN